jgi:hypothetical protein
LSGAFGFIASTEWNEHKGKLAEVLDESVWLDLAATHYTVEQLRHRISVETAGKTLNAPQLVGMADLEADARRLSSHLVPTLVSNSRSKLDDKPAG